MPDRGAALTVSGQGVVPLSLFPREPSFETGGGASWSSSTSSRFPFADKTRWRRSGRAFGRRSSAATGTRRAKVPFDPADAWGTPPAPLWRGRRGHRVRGRLNGFAFESAIVPRSRRFWLIVDATTLKGAGAEIGKTVGVQVQPSD